MRSRSFVAGLATLLVAFGPNGLSAQQPESNVNVTVSYTGKGTVSDANQIWVFLFKTPDVNASSQPLDVRALGKNGSTAQFTAVGSEPVYVYVLYDEKGGYDGRLGPPPAGTPIGMYSLDKKTAAPVKAAKGTQLKITFGDSVRWAP